MEKKGGPSSSCSKSPKFLSSSNCCTVYSCFWESLGVCSFTKINNSSEFRRPNIQITFQNSAHELSLSTVKIAHHDLDCFFFKLVNFRKKSIVFILYQSKCPPVPILSKFGDAKKCHNFGTHCFSPSYYTTYWNIFIEINFTFPKD